MTLKDVARQLNTTTMTIYRRCARAGLNIDDLRDDVTHQITPEGVAVIASLFDDTRPSDGTQGITEAQNANTTTAERYTTDSVAVLTAKLEAAQDTIRRLEEERDRLITQLEAATNALEREQADRAAERQQLLPRPGDPRKGLLSWLRRK